MKSEGSRHINIHHAFDLDSDPDSIIPYYAKWSETYDNDVIDGYVGIDLICELMHKQLQNEGTQSPQSPHTPSPHTKNSAELKIADVGCGTGLAGKSLADRGYNNIDGIDLSSEMIVKAAETGYYTRLHDGVNINQELEAKWNDVYDAVISLGVFTPGHVLPEALYQLIQLTRPGGWVLVSTRPEYYDTTEYQKISDNAVATGMAILKRCYKDAPYRNDGNAH